MEEVDIGIFGGSGFYDLFKEKDVIPHDLGGVSMHHGRMSEQITVGKIKGKTVAFMPRHGKNHRLPPHMIPYKANIQAFKDLGVKKIIAPCAAGSLQPNVKPGDIVICDQLVDRTNGREDTFFNGRDVAHISFAEPYCPSMRKTAADACKKLKLSYHDKGTVVVINGPRFATKAESRWYSTQGWEVINMTQYPESVLAREAGICYCGVSLITDYDAGLEGNPKIKPVTAEEVGKIFKENNEKVKKLIEEIVKNMDTKKTCSCQTAIDAARI